ncbi:putative leucine-rich repeat-containing protein DDB_G0290503 [Mastacembelus armatus]|uniref:putative leucine-rich repeat-containing protein DDB_G0290503 n=1 Tax=Mastacembelus armatus TaxID=205130 RepID=UPI000E45E3D4|nr:putative leucine-rich repeat-containing protein DDB_G0290503 [Mastacembelus armatus]
MCLLMKGRKPASDSSSKWRLFLLLLPRLVLKLFDSCLAAAGFGFRMNSAPLFFLPFCLVSHVSQGRSESLVPQVGHIGTGVDPPAVLPVLWDELRGLKELVLSLRADEVGRRLVLRSLESRLRDREVEAEQQRQSLDELGERTEADKKLLMELNSDLRRKVEQLEEQEEARAVELASLQLRLNVSECSVVDLKKKNSALAAELPFLQTRLRASESTVEQLRRKNAVLAARICNTESLMEELRTQISEFSASNSSSNESERPSRLNARVEELSTNSEVLQSRLNSLEEKLNTSAEKQQLTTVLDQLRNRLNSSQCYLDELMRSSADQSGRLFSVETRLKDMETHLDELKTQNTAEVSVVKSRLTEAAVHADSMKQLQVRLSTAESHLHQLQTKQTDQISKLMTLQGKVNMTESLLDNMNTESLSRLRISEKQLEDLKMENTVQSNQLSSMESKLTDSSNTTAALELRLSTSKMQLEHVKAENTELLSRLRAGEKQLEDLKTENTDRTFDLMNLQSQVNTTESLLDKLNTELLNSLRISEKQLEGLKTENAALEVRLGSAETYLEQLQAHAAVQSDQLSLMASRLTDTNATAALEVRLSSSEAHLEQLEAHAAVLETRLSVSEQHLEDLKTESTDELKVAFSAGLTDSGSVGPFDEETTLIFSKTITNVGRAYNKTAGVFTAPVRGVYFFSFTATDYLKGYMGLHLYRNNQPIVFSLDLNDHGGYASTSNAVALQLEEGDRVRLSLPASYRLYDDSQNFCIFSGFLLFPV